MYFITIFPGDIVFFCQRATLPVHPLSVGCNKKTLLDFLVLCEQLKLYNIHKIFNKNNWIIICAGTSELLLDAGDNF
jgi:hypothetical protein